MSVVLVPVASPIHDKEAVSRVMERVIGSTRGYVDVVHEDIVTRPEDAPRGYSGYVVLVLTGGTEHIIAGMASEKKPMLLIAHERLNSLPAAVEAYSFLRDERLPVWIASLDEPIDDVRSFTRAVRAWAKARGARIGVVGGVSEWLVYSRSRREDLERIGLELVEIPMTRLLEEMNRVGDDEALAVARDVMSRAREVRVSEASVVEASRLYIALKRIMGEHGLKAITIRCFDLLVKHGVSACLALALLNSEGFAAGCEGDVPAVVAMLFSLLLTGSPGFMANLTWITGDEILLTHCTIPLSMAYRFSLDTNFETGKGVSIEGYVRPMQVTILRLSRDLRRIRIIPGYVITGEPISRMYCRTQVVVKTGEAWRALSEAMGNHHIVAPGDIAVEASYLAELLGIEVSGGGRRKRMYKHY